MTDNALMSYRPRFARAGNDDLHDDGSQTLPRWNALVQPYADAADVWKRAVYGSFGEGPGVYDEEILPAGLTLSGMAKSGSMFGARPWGSLGAGGHGKGINLTDEQIETLRQMRAANVPNRKIAEELGVSTPSVSRLAQRHGIDQRAAGNPGVGRVLTAEQEAELAGMRQAGDKQEYLATKFGVHQTSIPHIMKRVEGR